LVSLALAGIIGIAGSTIREAESLHPNMLHGSANVGCDSFARHARATAPIDLDAVSTGMLGAVEHGVGPRDCRREVGFVTLDLRNPDRSSNLRRNAVDLARLAAPGPVERARAQGVSHELWDVGRLGEFPIPVGARH
jgi:hypothetical protein